MTPADFTVTPDGYLNVFNQPTGVRITGSYIIESETQFTIRMPQGNDKGELVLGDDKTVTYMDVTIPKNLDKIHVTSVKFVPMTSYGSNLKVNFLEGKKIINNESEIRYLYATGSQIRFRVNPVEAKLGTDFTVLETMDQFKLSRSGVEFSLQNATLGEGGLVYADFKYTGIEYSEKKLPSDNENYTLAAGIKNSYTGEVIYSDYVTFNTRPQRINPAFVNDKDAIISSSTIMKFELARSMGNSVNIAEKIFMKAYSYDKIEYYTLDHFGFDKPEFTITKKVANEASPFTVEGTTIKVSDVSYQAQGKTVNYIVTAKIGDFIIKTQEISVTMIEEVGNLNLIEDVTVKDFNGSAQAITLKLATGAINQFNTYFQTDVTNLNGSVTFAITDEKGKDATNSFITFNTLSNTPEITVKEGTKSGIYNVVMTVTRKTATTEMKSETKFSITVEGIEFQETWKTPGYWEENDAIIIKVDKTSGDFRSDLTKLFTIPEELGVNVQFTIKNNEKNVTIVGNEAHVVEPKEFAMNTTLSGNIVAQLVNATDKSLILDQKEISVTFENPFKSFSVAGTEKLKMIDATVSGEQQKGVELDINDLLTLTLMVDDRAGNTQNIISPKDDKANPSIGNNTILPANQLYGAKKIIYKLPENHDKRFRISEAGVLTWKNTGSAIVTPVETSVTIVINNNWKPIEQTVTVTVGKDKD